ncbi:unnamed protein product [Lasius platythorax]|uniref:Uncharacterized protein n=1 Tax=Lasius platythorax TaxID=488582 RepID=A0AAV2NVN7_9HYME
MTFIGLPQFTFNYLELRSRRTG